MASRSRAIWGLVPLEESGGHRRRLGHITRQGNSLLRFLLVEAAQVTVCSDQEWHSKLFHWSRYSQASFAMSDSGAWKGYDQGV